MTTSFDTVVNDDAVTLAIAPLFSSDTPWHRMPGVLPSPMRLAHRSHNRKVEARMSRSVHGDCSPSVPVCPTVPAFLLTGETSDREVRMTPLSGLYARFSCWFFG